MVAVLGLSSACSGDGPTPTGRALELSSRSVTVMPAAVDFELSAKRSARTALALRVVSDVEKNAAARFGQRKGRSKARVCEGARQVLAHYISESDVVEGIVRTPALRAEAIERALQSGGCQIGEAPASVFAARPTFMMARAAAVDSLDQYIADSLRVSLQYAMDDYSVAAPTAHASFTSGMTELEAGIFEGWACDLDAQFNTYEPYAPGGGGGSGGGEEPMAIFSVFSGGCGRAAAGGCAANTALNWTSIGSGARAGALWGPWGAVAGGVGVAAMHCGAGALAGWIICRYVE